MALAFTFTFSFTFTFTFAFPDLRGERGIYIRPASFFPS